MPNTIEEAVDMLPEPMSDKSKDINLVTSSVNSPDGDSDTASSIAEQEKLTTVSQESQSC